MTTLHFSGILAAVLLIYSFLEQKLLIKPNPFCGYGGHFSIGLCTICAPHSLALGLFWGSHKTTQK